MKKISRREFLELSGKLAAVMGLSAAGAPQLAEALEQLSSGGPPVIWLQGQSCSGCSVSLLNTDSPSIAEVLLNQISLRFNSTLSTATGHQAIHVIEETVKQGGFILAIEGSVPDGMPDACRVGEMRFSDQVIQTAKRAKAVVAIGTCAAFGGIPAAENNPTGAISVLDFLKKQGITTPVITIPGCPTHPDWVVGTLVHLAKFGMPKLNEHGSPTMFFGKCVHEQCNFFADYERENFATEFGAHGCQFKMGCAGPITKADCPTRQWNSGTNWCVKCGAPCIGCAGPHFAKRADYPLVTVNRAVKSH